MKETDHTIIVIPAYEPDDKMIDLLQKLKEKETYEIIVVDDGSGENYKNLFDEARKYAIVLNYDNNQGKGYALKYAFSYIKKNFCKNVCIVTADSDGQHMVSDIVGVVKAEQENSECLILGCREFTGNVPARSRFGNSVTCKVFQLLSGANLKDTQTGLRAFSGVYLDDMILIEGNRYEYEMNMLSVWAKQKRSFYEYVIETIYIDDNKSSHFNPIKDSFKIYKEMFLFRCKK